MKGNSDPLTAYPVHLQSLRSAQGIHMWRLEHIMDTQNLKVGARDTCFGIIVRSAMQAMEDIGK